MRNIEKAITKCAELHAGQKRKGDAETPYIVHPMETAMIVAKHTSYEPAVIAAVLHDTVEDCDYTIDEVAKEFGPEVSSLVNLLTDDKKITDWQARKDANLAGLRENKLAYFIKAADAVANMRSLVGALREHGSVVWDKFNAPKDAKIAHYRTILHDTREILPAELLEEYVGLLKDLEYSEHLEKGKLGFVGVDEK